MRILILPLLLCQVAIAGQGATAASELTATRLMELFEQKLLETPAADVTAVEAELERMRAADLPRLRLSQRANWDFGEPVDLGLGASLSWGVVNPTAEIQLALTGKRLELARHNRKSQLSAQLLEFRRTLRLLEHLDGVEELLSRHRRQLSVLRPEWRDLEMALGQPAPTELVAGGGASAAPRVDPRSLPAVAAQDPGQIDYLEVSQALERTRRERSLLLLAVADMVDVDPRTLSATDLGSPPLTGKELAACLQGSGFENSETIRAGLLLEESLISERLEGARSRAQVTLDLSSNARYSNSSTGRPLNAGVRLALQVALPASEGVSSDVSLSVTPTGLSQELSIGWPPRSGSTSSAIDPARRGYAQAVERARLNALRDLAAVQDARDRLLLRETEMAFATSRPAAGVVEIERLNETAQAELALLNAQLELDLALMKAAANCDANREAGSTP